MKFTRRLFGLKSSAEKRAEQDALNAQRRSQGEAVEEAQRLRAERAAANRRLRDAGRRSLAYGGEAGLATTYGA